MNSDKRVKFKEKVAEEFRLFLLISAYLAAIFVAFHTYRTLISRELGVSYFRYGAALIEALVVAKVILIGKAMGLSKKKTSGTLAFSVLRASLVYGVLVAVFAVFEHVIEGLVHGKTFVASFEDFSDQGVNEIFGRGLVIFVAFIPFFAFWELGHLMGDKKLSHLFFRKGVFHADG